MIIRDELPSDIAAIRTVTTAAFAQMPHSSHTEAAIIEALRRAGALTLSLVAMDGDELVGHVAFSPVTIDDRAVGWYGLGPVSVRPDRQRQGIGGALIRAGLERLKALDARGCVLLGEPDYYERFGFRARPELRLPDVPPEYFMTLAFGSEFPQGTVAYHAGFAATDPT